jgi:prepilin-type N-terminal cleavage/methylation domain-containing protein
MFKGKEKGYTLVEVLVALGILGFGLLAVATMQVTSIKTNSRARDISQGLTLAQAKVEELMNLSYNNDLLKDTNDDGGNITVQDTDQNGVDDDDEGSPVDSIANFGLNQTGGSADQSQTNGRYNIFWNVAINQPRPKSKTVRVIVTWTERGRVKSISLDFVRTNLS